MLEKTRITTGLACAMILAVVLVSTAAVTQVNWYTAIKAMPEIDARSFGALCNASHDDGPSIQAAIDSVPATNGASPAPVVVRIPPGFCNVATTILLRRSGVILRGWGSQENTCTGTNCSTVGTTAGTALEAAFGFAGPLIRADAGDVTVPAATVVLRSVAVQDLTLDTTFDSSFTHPQIEVGSVGNGPPWRGLTFFGFRAGGIKVAASFTSTVATTARPNPYPSEGFLLEDSIFQASDSVASSAPAIRFLGVNQSRIQNCRIAGLVVPGATGTASDVAAIEVDSDNYALGSAGVSLDNVTGGGFAVWLRIKGADQTKVPTGGGCSTPPISGGCNVGTPYHVGPAGVYVRHGYTETFNRGIVIGDESNSSGGSRFPMIDFYADSTNRYLTPYGSSFKLADVNWLYSGEISTGLQEGTLPIVLGAQVQQVSSIVPWNGGAYPTQTSNPANLCIMRIAPLSFAALPSPTGCQGMTAVCTNCSCASGSACSSGGGYRGVAWNGSSWVGQ